VKALCSIGAAAVLFGQTCAAQSLIFPPGEDPRFNWESFAAISASPQLAGQSVAILSPWLGPDKRLADSVFSYFEAATGVKIAHVGSDSVEQQIVIDTEAGSPPDIVILSQPGLISSLAAKGHLRPLGQQTEQWLTSHYAAGASWAELGRYSGPDGEKALFAFPFKAELKSLVWYVPENFAEMGYDVPGSIEALKALSAQIVADGGTPWCIGLGSGGASGWPGTDWVEDFMLRLYGSGEYQAWIRNDLRFDDPKVIAAIEEFGAFALSDSYVSGGARAAASTDFRDSPQGLFTSPPQCYLHRQASFITTFFPENVEIGVDADFFYFPAYSAQPEALPMLGSGTLFLVTSDAPGAMALIEFLKSEIAHEVWMAQTGFLTPHLGVNANVYGDSTLRRMGEILHRSTSFHFDGSDLMPGAIGTGVFWSAMVDYLAGAPATEVAQRIQRTWDTLK
jgi:alpha-glucoside transport system substrate-binding protein